MKAKACLFAVLTAVSLLVGGLVRAEPWVGWPAGLEDLEDSTIHAAAMAKIAEFGETFRNDPVSEDVKASVDKDRLGKDKNAWMGATLELVAKVLGTHPPDEKNVRIRRAALVILDYPLHVDNQRRGGDCKVKAEWRRAVGDYYQGQVQRALKEIKTARVADGLMIWKMYNMGFLVRSKSRTVGFDINAGAVEPLGTEQVADLVGQMDILFVSHAHGDHFSAGVVNGMLKAGKKVVLPTPAASEIARMLPLDDNDKNLVSLYDNYQEPVELDGVRVRAFPGWQDRATPCSVYAVTLDGYTVSHNGDNVRTKIYPEIANCGKVDVLLANCWSGMLVSIDAIKPELVITGHENELSHPVSHRESHLKTFRCLDRGKNLPRCMVLEWGEGISHPARPSSRAANGSN